MSTLPNDMQQHFLQLYQREFPEKEHPHIIANTSTSISAGWESDLFSLRLDYEEAAKQKSEEIILKLYHGQTGTQKAQREFHALQQLAHSRYPVPRALFTALDDSPFGRACVAMEKIQGRTLAQAFDESPREKQQALVARFCQLFVDLHILDWKPFVPDPTLYQTKSIIRSWLAEARTYVAQWSPQVFDPIFDWLQERSHTVTCQQLSVTHGDFHPENVLLRDDGALFVIDWTAMDITDYRFDLAWTLLLLSTLASAELREAVLNTYEQYAGHSVEHIEFFEVIACCRRLFDITVSLSSGATALGMKPGAEDLMRQKIGHIRAVYAQLQQETQCSLPEIEKLILTLS